MYQLILHIFSDQRSQIKIETALNAIWNMSTEFSRTSQQYKLLEGTIIILKDNNIKKDLINKIYYLCDCIKISPINENDATSC